MVRYLTENDVQTILTMPLALELVERAMKDRALGRAVDVPRVRARIPQGTLHVLEAGAPDLDLVGYKAYYSAASGTRFFAHLFEAVSGKPVAIMEASWLGTFAATFLLAVPCAAQDAQDFGEETLTGDRGGVRTRLARKGIVWDIGYSADMLANVSGGLSRGASYMGHFEAKLLVDMGKAAGWTGNRVFLHAIWDHGDRLNSRRVGSFMGVDNIEVATNTAKMFQAWTEQRLLGNTLWVLGGLYAVDSEFNVNEASEVFLHPAFGTSPELAQTGRNGPSIFPTTSVLASRTAIPSDRKRTRCWPALRRSAARPKRRRTGTWLRARTRREQVPGKACRAGRARGLGGNGDRAHLPCPDQSVARRAAEPAANQQSRIRAGARSRVDIRRTRRGRVPSLSRTAADAGYRVSS